MKRNKMKELKNKFNSIYQCEWCGKVSCNDTLMKKHFNVCKKNPANIKESNVHPLFQNIINTTIKIGQ